MRDRDSFVTASFRAGHDVRGAGSCAWGLGAGLSAVRCVDARPGQLAAAGDDGNVMVWEF